MPGRNPICESVPMGTRLAVYCGSNGGTGDVHRGVARELGAALVERGVGLVYGGGDVGLMGEVADAVLAGGGEVIGVIPTHLVRAEVAHRTLTELHVVESMHARKAMMCDLVDGFVVLPGGFGTLDEALEILTWNQLGLIAKPIVFLDQHDFFGPLFEMFDRAADAGFLRVAHRGLAQRARTVAEAIEMALASAPEIPHKWLDRDAR
jgi:uncharacterized protein (TIGR00730 family)